jgi:hypothetical protein
MALWFLIRCCFQSGCEEQGRARGLRGARRRRTDGSLALTRMLNFQCVIIMRDASVSSSSSLHAELLL